MTTTEWQREWSHITGLWPNWNVTEHIRSKWLKWFRAFRPDVVRNAVDDHYDEHSTKLSPDGNAIFKLCGKLSVATKSPEQVEYEQMFYSMPALDQMRHLLRSYVVRRDRAESDYERSQMENLISTAESQIMRLEKVDEFWRVNPPKQTTTVGNIGSLCRRVLKMQKFS